MNVMAGAAPSMLSDPGPVTEVWIWGGVVILVVVGFWIVLLLLRRRFYAGMDRSREQGLAIEKLEKLHSSGQISDEEFRSLRRNLLGLVAGEPEKEKDDSTSRPTDEDDDGKGCADQEHRPLADEHDS